MVNTHQVVTIDFHSWKKYFGSILINEENLLINDVKHTVDGAH